MGSMEGEATTSLQGQAEIWQLIFSFVDSMALKCAVELRIADIIHSHGGPITLSQIASCFDPPPSDIATLSRLMRLLVRRRVFAVHQPSDGGATLYGLTQLSRWLLHDSELSLAPMAIMQTHPRLVTPWHCYSQCVKEGGLSFKKAHGIDIWDFASQNDEFNKIFNDAMVCASRNDSSAIISGYKDGFNGIRTLVDVGGGTGEMAAQIVKAYPHIKAINFDLPHVIAVAPKYDGVSHIGGNMFDAIPQADAVFIKWILHGWTDEDCVKILGNCKRAIPKETGKVIIVDVVLQPGESDGNHDHLFDDAHLGMDLVMSALTFRKERTEVEWKKILEDAGFHHYKIIHIPAFPSIIEAY